MFSSHDAHHVGMSGLEELVVSEPSVCIIQNGQQLPREGRRPVQGHTVEGQGRRRNLVLASRCSTHHLLPGSSNRVYEWGEGQVTEGRKRTPLLSLLQAPAAKLAGKQPDPRASLLICTRDLTVSCHDPYPHGLQHSSVRSPRPVKEVWRLWPPSTHPALSRGRPGTLDQAVLAQSWASCPHQPLVL